MLSSQESRVTIKVFSDDLQDALRNFTPGYRHGSIKTFFGNNTGIAEAYFNKHIELVINRKRGELKYLEYSIENNAHFITFSISHSENWETIQVKADYFMELFPTQVNIFQFKNTNTGKSMYLKIDKSQTRQLVTF